MRLLPHEIAIGILGNEFIQRGQIPDPNTAFDGNEEALAFLKELTGEDFGEDAAMWKRWFAACDRELLEMCYGSLRSRRMTD